MTTTITNIFIDRHTTSSTPDPHILYILDVSLADGSNYQVMRRYSQFAALHAYLGDPFVLPPKKNVTTALIPSAWVSNDLIAERKDGLLAYLNVLLRSSKYQGSSLFLSFLNPAFVSFLDAQDVITPFMISLNSLALTPPSVHMKAQAAGPIAAAYYPDWAAGSLSPWNVDFSKFDILFFAFVVPNSSSVISWDQGSQDTLRNLVSAARQSGQGTKVVLSIGGWGGSYWFSNAMSNATNRQKLVTSLVGAVNSFGLDGVDIDWEYPNSPGSGNPYSWADSGNLLSFLQLLRSALGWQRIISAAVPHRPWLGPNGQPLTNVSDFAAQMTFVNIMNYDVNGASANPGPNAPLNNGCGTSKQPETNAMGAVAQWSRAGMPASKILLGLALYGYASQSTATRLSGSSVPGTHARSRTTSHVGDGLTRWWGQQVPFVELVRAGALRKQGGVYVADNGYTMGWDDCSDTPYLFSVAKTTVVSYDDTYSMTDKANFARQAGLAGCFTWSMDQDDGYTLQMSIRSALGK